MAKLRLKPAQAHPFPS